MYGVWQGLLANLAVTAMVITLWSTLRGPLERLGAAVRTAVFGLVMGGGALLAMSLAVHLSPGVLFDLRVAPLAVAGFFGGPLAAALAVAPALLYRIGIGGHGVWAGCIDITFVAAIAALLREGMRGRRVRRRDVIAVAAWAVLVDALSYLALPPALIVPTFLNMGGPSSLLDFVGVTLAGMSLLGDDRRRDLAKSNAIYRAVIEALPDCLNVKDTDGRFIAANPATALLMQAPSPEDLIGKTDFDFYPADTAHAFRAEEMRIQVTQREATIEQEATFADGRTRWLSTLKVPFRDPQGDVIGLITHNRDITPNKLMQIDLVNARQQLADAMASMADGLVMYDRDARIVLCNEQYLALFPMTADIRVPGTPLADVLRQAVARGEERLAEDQDPEAWIAGVLAHYNRVGERVIPLADGRRLEARTRPAGDGGCLTVFSDVTAREMREATLRHSAEHDSLTGLANRAAFEARLGSLHQAASARPLEFSVMLIDLDRFKQVNDTFGHRVGDQLLIEVGRRLQAACRAGDVIARLGGDEFAILSEGNSMETGAARLAQRVLDGIGRPFTAAGATIMPGGSVGYTIFPLDPSEPEILVTHADQALYAAKASGRRRSARFHPGMDDAAAMAS